MITGMLHITILGELFSTQHAGKPIGLSSCDQSSPTSQRQSESQIFLRCVFAKFNDWPLGNNATGLHDVVILSHTQREFNELLDQQNGHVALLLQTDDHILDLVHDRRLYAFRRLIEQKQSRPAHKRACNRELLLLPTAERARNASIHLPEDRKRGIHLLNLLDIDDGIGKSLFPASSGPELR